MNAGIQLGDTFVAHADFHRNVLKVARGLVELGVRRGDSVAIMMRNDIPFLEVTLAARYLGAYPVPLNWHLSPEEARYILENSEAKILAIHRDLLPALREAVPPGVKVIAVDTHPAVLDSYGVSPSTVSRKPVPLTPGELDWTPWLAGLTPWDQPQERETASMIYTSGTTGRQKGVRREPSSPEQYQRTLATAFKVMGLAPGIRSIVPAPLYHSAPNFFAIIGATLETFMVIMPRFDAEEFLRLVDKFKITHVQMVPVMFVRLLKLPESTRKKYDLSSLQNIIHAAAPCPADVKKAMIEWWGPIINEYYGSTELGILTYANSEDALKHPGTVGKPIDDVALNIVDPAGASVPIGQPGTIYARVTWYPDFTYQHDAEKRRSIEREGLITPGDVGYVNDDGYLFLCDRANDMVISGGVNIYPAEIEARLIQLDGVRDCAVFGIPDEEYGETLAAIIEKQNGAELTEKDVLEYLRAHLAGFKIPRHIEFRSDLPREDSGKLFKRRLREPFWEHAGRRI